MVGQNPSRCTYGDRSCVTDASSSATSAFVEGREMQAILHLLREQKADLVVIGLHQHDIYLSRLWSLVYDVSQDEPCSVLGVY